MICIIYVKAILQDVVIVSQGGLFPLLLSISLFKKCVIPQLIDCLTINQLIEIDNLSINYSGENEITLTQFSKMFSNLLFI